MADNTASIVRISLRNRLTETRKIVTRKTIASIRVERVLSSASRQMFIRNVTGAKSFLFIEKGRRAGGKMPVMKKGKNFVPVPELAQWFRKLGIPQNAWFLIMRKIARQGIQPTAIIKPAMQSAMPRIQQRGAEIGRKIARELLKSKK